MAKFDVIIKNGTVFDGKGNPPVLADIGIKGSEIKEIGDLGGASANEVIDASNKYVTPGFIDLTNHSDTHWTLFTQPSQESLFRQGITTIVGGNCGSSLAPFVGEASAKEIERWVDISQTNINWRTMEEFLNEVGKLPLGVNFCTLLGYNTAQRAVLGKEVRLPTPEEIVQTKAVFKSAFEQGAFGVSTNFGVSNIKSARDEENIDLFTTVGHYGLLAKHHPEDEGENLLPSIARIISLAKKARVKTHITHFKALGRASWEYFPEAIKMINTARQENFDITCDFFPYTRPGSNLFMLMPSWFRNMPTDEAKEVLREKDDIKRVALIEYLKKKTLHYDKIIIASCSEELKGKENVVGKTIGDLIVFLGIPGEEIILYLLEKNDLRVSIFSEVISDENILKIAQEEFSAISSDGVGYQSSVFSRQSSDLPHPRSFGAFPRALNMLVKEKKVLTWEKAIYKMNGLPARILGITRRGILASGNIADIIVIDPQEISDRATYNNPFQYAKGIDQVLINGKLILDKENITGKFSGQIIRRNGTW